MRILGQDIVYALRLIRQHRGFAALIVLCLALGIGVNTAIFSVVDAVLLRPLPYKSPEKLVVLVDVHQGPGTAPEEYSVSSPNYLAFREQKQVFERLEAMDAKSYNLTSGGEPERVAGAAVTAGFFDLLGTQTVRGRTLLPEEDVPGGPLSAVISYGLWQRRFGSDPHVLGSPLLLDGRRYSVVGVLQPDFRFLQDADLWVPLGLDPANPPQRLNHYLFVAGRLRPEVNLASARSRLDATSKRLARETPELNAGWNVKMVGLRENLVGDLRRNLLVLLAAVGFVLLIACANVGNLLLTRVSEQRNEIAIRAAFGASRGRIVRQLVTESVVLSLLGGGVGLLLAGLAVRILPRIGPADVNLFRTIHIDVRVLAFTLFVSLLTGFIPGLIPMGKVTTTEVYTRLRGGGKRATEGTQGRRLQSALVVSEVALALVLLVCSGLMIKSFRRLNQTNPGFDAGNVLLMQISLPESQYADPNKAAAFWHEALTRVDALPGVLAAGATTALPVNDFALTSVFTVEHRAPATPGEVLIANFRRVSPDYLRVLKIPLRAGRTFTWSDDAGALPVAVVSQEMARRYWPGEYPIGKRIQRAADVASHKYLTVVGVVGDVEDSALGAELGTTFYVPVAQGARPTMHLAVRTTGEPLRVATAVRREVLSIDKNQPVAEITTMEDWVARSLGKRRFSTLMLTLFAGLGVILAVVGIYGVLSYSVSQRGHEIGVRMALGAQSGDVVLLILRRGLGLTVLGLLVGLTLTLFSTRLLGSMLYEVAPTDPTILLSIAAGLTAVALAASYLPARRAARFDPIVSLRHE